jgi:hypothetical protein
VSRQECAVLDAVLMAFLKHAVSQLLKSLGGHFEPLKITVVLASAEQDAMSGQLVAKVGNVERIEDGKPFFNVSDESIL